MLLTTLLTAGVFITVMAAMAIGVIISNRRIKGSCGGLANFRDSSGNTICDACTSPSPECSGDPTKKKHEEKCSEI